MKQSLENLNIALVHDWITNHAGGERVLVEISKLFPKAPIYTSVYDRESASPFFKDKKIYTSLAQNIPLMKQKRQLLIPLTPFLFEQFDLSQYDLVISSSSMAAKGVLTKPNTKHICYCHTPARYLWEPQTDPRASQGIGAWAGRKIAHKMRIWDKVSSDRVDSFIANSEYVSKRIKKYYQRESEVIYPPVDIERFKISETIGDYFIFVSRLVAYKKCEVVIRAFNDLGIPLKVIGKGPEKQYLQKIAKGNIEFLGYLSDKDVAKYYSEARAFVFMAEEDFGIVPVEAMAAGRPVIAFNQGGVAESVVEGKTGMLFGNQTSESLTEAIKSFDPDKFDPKVIRSRAEEFSTEVFRTKFMDLIQNSLLDSNK